MSMVFDVIFMIQHYCLYVVPAVGRDLQAHVAEGDVYCAGTRTATMKMRSEMRSGAG